MADFSMNVNYAKPQATSLGDMLGMASGIQNFQQAQQLNPLALEKAQIENQVLKQKNDERLRLQEFTSNPANWQTNGRIDMDKINSAIPKIAPLTGADVITSLSGLHKSQTEAASAKQSLTQTERNIIAIIDALIAAMPVAVKASVEKPQIYMNHATWELFMQAQIAAGNGWYANLGPAMAGLKYMGLYDIAVCPGLPANTLIMAQKSNLWFGTWLESDMNNVAILDMADKDLSQNVRYSARFYAGCQIGFTSEIAAYGPGLS